MLKFTITFRYKSLNIVHKNLCVFHLFVLGIYVDIHNSILIEIPKSVSYECICSCILCYGFMLKSTTSFRYKSLNNFHTNLCCFIFLYSGFMLKCITAFWYKYINHCDMILCFSSFCVRDLCWNTQQHFDIHP